MHETMHSEIAARRGGLLAVAGFETRGVQKHHRTHYSPAAQNEDHIKLNSALSGARFGLLWGGVYRWGSIGSFRTSTKRGQKTMV